MKTRVLFLCIHNSARSQIAEAYLKKYGNNQFDVESAGLVPGNLNPLAVAVLAEENIDIKYNSTKSVNDFYDQQISFDYVITVCDPEASESCPVFPGLIRKINWNFADPSKFEGNSESKLEQTRIVRDQIKKAVLNFVKEYASPV